MYLYEVVKKMSVSVSVINFTIGRGWSGQVWYRGREVPRVLLSGSA